MSPSVDLVPWPTRRLKICKDSSATVPDRIRSQSIPIPSPGPCGAWTKPSLSMTIGSASP
jgi:hypothetical protein